MFQIGFLEILVIGPKRLPEVIKILIKFYRKIESKLSGIKNDIEQDIGASELQKDVFNELRMEELEKSKASKDD